MIKTKYYDIVNATASRYKDYPKGDLPPFDLNQIAAKNWFSAQKSKLIQAALKPIYRFGRAFMPVINLAGFTHVVRDSEVRQILARPLDFQVPFGPEMNLLAGGETFVLGLEGDDHARQNMLIHKIVRPSDADQIVALAKKFGDALIENSAGRIDAIDDYFKRVASEICIRYFGFAVDDASSFADWTISTSALLFADPYGGPDTAELGVNGAARLRAVIDNSIIRLKRNMGKDSLPEGGGETLLERLLVLQISGEENITDAEIRAILYGLVAGFIPTNTLAAAKMLEELNRRPDAYRAATNAASNGEREALKKILLEASRLNPGLAPGQWRYCPKDTHIDVGGKRKNIKAGTLVMVSTMSAMRDKRAFPKPQKFWPERTDDEGNWIEPDLLFGAGVHVCIGKYLAIEQITETMMVLLKQKSIRPAPGKAGRMQLLGPAPRHLEMVYDTPSSRQTMFMVLADADPQHDKKTIDAEISRFGNPATLKLRQAFDATDIVHFSSLSSIETEKGLKIALELSVDGSATDAITQIAEQAGAFLRPIFSMAGLDDDQDIADFMTHRITMLHGKPWGATGIDYNGLSEFSVSKTEKQAHFADFAARVLEYYTKTETARGSHPSLILSYLRHILRGDPAFKAEATEKQLAFIQEAQAKDFDAFSIVTQKMRLKFTDYRDGSHLQRFGKFAKTRDAKKFYVAFFLLSTVCAILFWPSFTGSLIAKIMLAAITSVLAAAGITAGVIVLLLAILRRHEERDEPFEHSAPLSKLREIAESDNPPGYQQNHVMAVGELKPGLFREFAHAFALWGIKMSIVHWFRPGLLNRMGTIHYARWWRIPGTKTVSFYSNFDGSWENYLEDFIMRNRWGQAFAWSNWQGFPKSQFMLLGGAADAQGFKRWIRIVQQIAPFWYSRFPETTSERIRKNGIIHIGTGLAKSATEAEEWLRCFSSMPRTENRIESEEVQALVFQGMKKLPYSVSLALKIPAQGSDLGEWLCWIRGKPMRAEGLVPADDKEAMEILVKEGILVPVPRPENQPNEYALAHSMNITFGDRFLDGVGFCETKEPGANHKDAKSSMSQAAIFGLSPAGMSKFSVPNGQREGLLSSFPEPFQMGMAARRRILGDVDENAPESWRWIDDPRDEKAAEAVLILYASDKEVLERMVTTHQALLENHGGKIISRTNCAPAWSEPEKADFEHFGYRDGISQPVIKGSSRTTKGIPARDLAEPGEFILGYPDSMDYDPVSPTLPPEADMGQALPVVIDDNLSRFPDFGDSNLSDAPRDLGRNGSYLVIRELKQDVKAFEAFTEDTAQKLNEGGYKDLYKIVGQCPDKEWIKAKLMGRWTNGRPLIGNPVFKPSNPNTRPAETENDFTYGEDDPHGLACPFGSHIRRTNPRDSKLPGDEGALDISNRHRILRRGRPYHREDTDEKGLFFACFCTDINRQFEFVQQAWSNASSFHGLENEPDPITGACPVSSITGEAQDRIFSIPTSAGPIKIEGLKNFVQVMAGGYFFVPSRSALSWLAETSLYAQPENAESQS